MKLCSSYYLRYKRNRFQYVNLPLFLSVFGFYKTLLRKQYCTLKNLEITMKLWKK